MCRNSVKWIYRLDESFSWNSKLPIPEDMVFRDASGTVRLILEQGGYITVTRGYAWNGCSPKFCLFDLVVGTPDGVVHRWTGRPKTYYASMIHDALYQFLGAGSPITRRQADACFLRLMGDSEFMPRYVYWAAVRLFGWLVYGGKKARRAWKGNRTLLGRIERTAP